MRRVLKVTEAKECKPLSSSRVDRWRRDRLILSNQIQNLLVTIRSNERFSANARFSNPEQSTEHPLLRQLKELQREIMAPTLECHVNEAAILKPFCDLCTSREMSDTIVGVALASLSNLIDLRCSFISKSGLEMILGIVYASKREVRDFSTHEVLLVRRLNLCVSCAGHPSARGLSEDTFVDMIHHAYKLAVHSMGSPLLRRTAEQCMKSIVTSLYSFVVENRSGSFASNKKHEEGTNDPMISVEKDEEEKEESTLSGCVMLRHICSLIRGRDNGDASNLDIQRSDAKESSKIAAVQLEGFLLVQCMLFVVHDFICNPGWEELLYTVQHELCRALLITGVSTNNIIVLFQILRTIHIVVKMASACVVPQTFSFIRAIHIDPLIRIAEELHSGLMSPRTASSPRLAASPSVPVGPSFHMNVTRMMDLYERRELLLESLVEFSGDPNFATFCYLQYDLSKRFSPLLDRLCTSLVENCFCMTDEETSDLLKKGNRGGGGGGVSYDFSADGFLTQMDALALEALNSFLHQTMLSFSHPSPLPPLPPVPAELTSLIEFRLEQKKLLMDFASRFRANAIKDGIPFLLEKATRVHSESSYRDVVRGAQGGQGGVQMDAPALILVEPAGGREVGMCLFHLSAMLDKRALGDYLGELGRESPAPIADGTQESIEALAAWEMKRETEHLQVGTVRFFEEQLKGFLEEFDYHNKPLLSCIRETVYHMCVPGEAQKIDRVMEAFAKVWMKSNSDVGKEINPFCSEQGPFIIAFSLILLNTDQHSGKMVKPMTLEDFRRMHRDSDGGSSLPEGYLDELYNDVKAHPIIMAEMIDAGFTNDVTWALEMHELDPSDDLLSKDPVLRYSKQLTGLHTIDEAMFQVLHPFVFSTVWKHCLRAFSNTLYACGSSLEHYLMEEDDIMDHAHTETKYPLPAAEEAYNRALEGLLFLAHTATHFGVRSAVDHVILVLLSQLSLDMEDAHGSVVRLGNQPFSLRCLQTLFSVLHDCVDMVMDSWGELGRFFSTAFLFGMFAKEASKVPASTSLLLSSPDSAESWEELLCHNPGIVVGGGVRRETSDRGWFAALLGGSSNTPERLKAQEEEKQRAIKRVKALFPSMEEFLNMIDSLEKKPQQQFFCALRDMGVMNTKNAAESYAASYTIILITEVAIRHSKDPVVLERYIKLCQQITSSISAIFEQPKSSDEANNNNSSNSNVNNNNNNNNNNGNNGNRARRVEEDEISIFDIGQSNRSEAYNYWLSLSVRVVRALLRAVVMFVCSDMHHETGIQILKLLTAAPQKLFTAAVAPLLSGTLLRLLTEERNFPHVPNRPLLMELFNTFCITARAHASFLVQQRIRKALIIIVKDERYDILRDAEDLVKTIVTCALEFSSENAESAGSPNQLGDTVQEERSESLANYLTVLCRRLVEMYGMGCVANKEKEWHQVWITSLCGLCVLVVSSRQSRDRGEALLCLQHSLLDSNIHQLPGTAIALLYEDVIFPLTEEICAPSPANVMGIVGTSSSSNKSSNNSSNNNNNNASATLASTEAFTKNPLGFFGTRRTAKSGNGASGCSSSSSVMKSRNQVTPTDLKCRVVSLLTRVFLQYVKFLGETPDVMQELWQRILGTLYALYTVPTERALSPTVSDAHGAKGNDGVTDDDGAFLREAIQEAVKNMIYVLSSTLSEPECVYTLRQAPYFWTSTKNLLRPFDFAEPLLAHIDNLDS